MNDFFGHNFGDLVLKEFSKGLATVCREYRYYYGRLGGDEFVIFGCDDSKEAIESKLEVIHSKISREYVVNGVSFNLGLSVGVSVRDKGQSIDFYQMLKEADVALYNSKQKGKNRIYILSEEEQKIEEKKKRLYSHLTLAVERGEFFVVYQPIFDYRVKEIVAFEALLRWDSKQFGLVSPGEFIPYLETTGDIIKVGRYIIDIVLKDVNKLKKPVHINVSSKQLFDRDFVDYLTKKIEEYNLSNSQIILEITETQEIPKDKVVLENFQKLFNIGIKLSLDDFGTGYSNLYTINQLRPTSIKIDIFLIRNIDKDKSLLSIVKAIKEMAEAIGINVVAEGVESREVAEILYSIGIYYMQGFYFSKPARIDEFLGGER